jgi:hypothetical protein
MSANFDTTTNRRLLSLSLTISFSNSKNSKICRAFDETVFQ